MLEDVGDPLGISLVGFLTPDGFHILRVSEDDVAGGFQDVVNGNPKENTYLKSISLPDSLISIGDEAFRNCVSLTQIDLPTGIKDIGKGAFRKTGLTSIVIPEGVTEIPEQMLANVTTLETVVIPASVTTVGKNAFNPGSGSSFDDLTFVMQGEQPPTFDDNAFGTKNPDNLTVIVPAGSEAEYKKADVIGDYITSEEEGTEQGYALSIPATASVQAGSTTTITATATLPDGAVLTWNSGNTGVARVSDAGDVTGVSAGTATITASITLNGVTVISDTCTVTVTAQQTTTGGSGSSDPTYSPTLDVSDGGEIRVSPRTPEAGDRVTITPDPDAGYEVGEVIVTDRSGDEVDVTANRDGTYTFTQPRGRVTIEVTFVPSAAATTFADVAADYWAYDEIQWAYENGYVNGTSASTFSPGTSISRQQVWMILARLSGADPASMAAARQWAVVNGISDGTNPGSAVTRQQLAALLFRFARDNGYDDGERNALTSFPDAGSVSGYAVEPLQWATASGIIGGTSDGRLNPTGTATRAQFAVMLYRFWSNI